MITRWHGENDAGVQLKYVEELTTKPAALALAGGSV
jgi:hypothetical protein